jgi:hypothetical protein
MTAAGGTRRHLLTLHVPRAQRLSWRSASSPTGSALAGFLETADAFLELFGDDVVPCEGPVFETSELQEGGPGGDRPGRAVGSRRTAAG